MCRSVRENMLSQISLLHSIFFPLENINKYTNGVLTTFLGKKTEQTESTKSRHSKTRKHIYFSFQQLKQN